MNKHLFISNPSEDRAPANKICRLLEERALKLDGTAKRLCQTSEHGDVKKQAEEFLADAQ